MRSFRLIVLVLAALALRGSYITQPTPASPIFPSTGAWAFVQAGQAQTAATPTNLSGSFGSLPAVGNIVFVGVIGGRLSGVDDQSTFVTDNQGNGYTRVRQTPATSAGSPPRQSLWCTVVAVSSGTYTVNALFTSNTFIGLFFLEYSGGTCNPDQDSGAAGSTSPYSCGSTTTRNANDLLIALLGTGGSAGAITFTPPTGFTTRASQTATASGETGSIADNIVAATGTFTPTFAASQNVTSSPCTLIAMMSK